MEKLFLVNTHIAEKSTVFIKDYVNAIYIIKIENPGEIASVLISLGLYNNSDKNNHLKYTELTKNKLDSDTSETFIRDVSQALCSYIFYHDNRWNINYSMIPDIKILNWLDTSTIDLVFTDVNMFNDEEATKNIMCYLEKEHHYQQNRMRVVAYYEKYENGLLNIEPLIGSNKSKNSKKILVLNGFSSVQEITTIYDLISFNNQDIQIYICCDSCMYYVTRSDKKTDMVFHRILN